MTKHRDEPAGRDEELRDLLRQWDAPALPDGLDERMLARYRRRHLAWWRRPVPVRFSLPFAASVLLAAAGAILAGRSRPPASESASVPASPVVPAAAHGRGRSRAHQPRRLPPHGRGHRHRGHGEPVIRPSPSSVGLGLMAAAIVAAAHPAGAGAGFSSATLDNGASVGFALLRSGPADPTEAIGDAALSRSNGVNRVLWDRQTGAYFGYRLEVKRQRAPRPFRVTVKPLDPEAEGPLRQQVACASCPPPTPLAATPLRYPAPQQLAEGDSLTLELLANPTTGEKILDVVKVSATPVSAATMKTAALRALGSWEAVQRANSHMAQRRLPERARRVPARPARAAQRSRHPQQARHLPIRT